MDPRSIFSVSLCVVVAGLILSPVDAESGNGGASWIDVLRYGAKADAVSDNSQAFSAAWKAACRRHKDSVFYVPNGRYLLNPVTFLGPCSNHITFQMTGNLIAGVGTKNSLFWVQFQNVNGLTFGGTGRLDGQGGSNNCDEDSGNERCAAEAVSLKFVSCSNVLLKGVKSWNSKHFHVGFDGCRKVRAKGLVLRARQNSPNTDGVHIQNSSGIKITGSNIATGDDCISVGAGSSNIFIHGVKCGPGHGISIGSLGKASDGGKGVWNVTVERVSFYGTQNGLRIKTWQGGKGFIRDVTYSNVDMINVSNPIIIDQFYCPYYSRCSSEGWKGVSISGVQFEGIRGTSATKVAVSLVCARASPCRRIHMHDVQLTYLNMQSMKTERAVSVCKNAHGSADGVISPPSCLR